MNDPLIHAPSGAEARCGTQDVSASRSRASVLRSMGYAPQRVALAPTGPFRAPRHPASRLLLEIGPPPALGADVGSLSLGPSNAWVGQLGWALNAAAAERGTEVDPTIPVACRELAHAFSVHASAIRDRILALVNASSVSRHGPSPDPALPPRVDVQAWLAATATVGRVVQDPTSPLGEARAALTKASQLAADAALAGFQGLSVLAARRSWRTRAEEERAPRLGRPGRERTEVDEIFKDAGFARGQVADSAKSVHDWCGLFASAALFRGGGLDEELRAGLYHTSNVSDFFHYTQRANARRTPRSIWADGRWWDLRAYHERRASVRSWVGRSELLRAVRKGDGPDLRPGDVVLINHAGGPSPDHIVMVDGWDPVTGTITTLEGNTIGVKAAGDGAERTDDGALRGSASGRSGVGMHTRELGARRRDRPAVHTRRRGGHYRARPSATLFGRGRQSAVDFEEHTFASRTVPEALRFTPPEQLSRREQERIRLRAPR